MRKKRVGRGGARGKTSGRGTKGQKARAGHSIKPAFRDVFESVPKLRGHNKNRARVTNPNKKVSEAIDISTIERVFKDGSRINPQILVKKKLIRKHKGFKPSVKILGLGEVSKKFIISNCSTSKVAAEKITKAGGVIHAN